MKRYSILLIGFLLAGSFVAGYAVGNKQDKKDIEPGVHGIGGIFFKCKDPKSHKKWYDENLGFKNNQYGTVFEWRQAGDSTKHGYTQWSPFKETTKYFEKEFMINYRVGNMDLLLANLKAKGILPIDTVESASYGKFVHIKDPEGNRIELWEANDIEYEKLGEGQATLY